MHTGKQHTASLLAALALTCSAGCGTDLETLLYQSLSAVGQSLFDQALTDVANNVADSFDQDSASSDQDEGAEDADSDGDGGEGSGGGEADDAQTDESPSDTLTGDPVAGEVLFLSCGACHCADGSGGCLVGASSLVGAEASLLQASLSGEVPHAGGPTDLTDQELADLAAFLAPDTSPSADAANGKTLFEGCLGCHCADASGDCLPGAPSLVGVDAATIQDRLRGVESHTGGEFGFTDEEIADIEAFLVAPAFAGL